MKTQDLFHGFKHPKTSEQEVLLTLIIQGSVSIFDFPWLSEFRTRVSDLQLIHGLKLDRKTETKKNKFGNTYNFAIHTLNESERENVILLYNRLNK